MKKTYIQPTVKVADMLPCTTLLTGSQWDRNYSSMINNDEEGDEDDFD